MSFGAFKYHTAPFLSHETDTQIGLIAGIQAAMVLGPTFIIGRLLDARLHPLVVVVGAILTSVGFLCASFAEWAAASYGIVVLGQSVLAGLGMSCFFIHSSTNATQVRAIFLLGYWPTLFSKRRLMVVGSGGPITSTLLLESQHLALRLVSAIACPSQPKKLY